MTHRDSQQGNVVSGSISTGGEIDDHLFSASAGDSFYFDVQSGSSSVLNWTLTAPGGATIFSDSLLDIGPLLLNATGNYVLRIAGNDAAATGAYQFQVNDVGNPSVTSLIFDAPVSGSIHVAGETDLYTFSGNPGDQLFFDHLSGSSSNLDWELTAPDGSRIFRDGISRGQSVVILDQAGTYTLTIDGIDDRTSAYSFKVITDGNIVSNINVGDSVSDFILKGGSHEYLFEAVAGIEYYFHEVRGGSNPTRLNWRLTAPDGTIYFNGAMKDQGPILFDQDGTWSVRLSSAGSFLSHRVYTFVIYEIPDPDPITILIGEEVNGSISVPADYDLFHFEGTAGNRYYVDKLSGNSPALNASLTAPDGTVLSNGLFGDIETDVFLLSGTYTLRVVSRSNSTATYRFRVYEIPPAVTELISIGDVVSGRIDQPGEIDQFQFAAQAGDRLYFDAQPGDFHQMRWKLFDAAGGQVFNFPYDDRDGIEIAETGDYLLTIDGNFAATRNYRFQIHLIPPVIPVPIEFGQAIIDEIGVPGEEHVYTFDAVAGQTLYFDAQNGHQYNFGWKLIAPDGSTTFNTSQLDYPDLLLNQSGQYTLILDAFTDVLLTYGFTVWNVPSEVPVPLPLSQLVSKLLIPTHPVLYEFNANAGDEFAMQVLANTRTMKFSLTAPDGSVIFDNKTGNALPGPLPQSGAYVLRIGPDPGSNDQRTPLVQFRLQQLDPPTIGAIDSQGTEFWLGFARPVADGGGIHEYAVFLTSAVNTTATVMVDSFDFVQIVDLVAGDLTRVDLPNVAISQFNERTEQKAVRVVADDEVALYGLAQYTRTTDAFLALPVDAWGTEHIVLGYENTGAGQLGQLRGSQFAVVARDDNTVLTIIPAEDINSHPAGVPFQVTLNRGDVYQLTQNLDAGTDVSGTQISSTNPIAVFGGHRCTNIPQGFRFCDYLVEQLPPSDSWGSHYLTVPLAQRIDGDTFRFVARDDGTTISIDGTQTIHLDRGEVHEQILEGPHEIIADKPILVAQYANSTEYDGVVADPFMMLITPIEQFQSTYQITALDDASFVNGHFVNLVVPVDAIGTILLDGVAVDQGLFSPIGASGWLGAHVQISEGSHTLNGSAPFAVSVYGFGTHDSYGYQGGASVAPVSDVGGLELGPESAALGVGSPHTVTATVVDANNQPLSGIRVEFQVTGTNPNSGFAFSDEFGQAEFTYTGTSGGNDSIVAFIGNIVDSASVVWITAAPLLTFTSPLDGDQFAQGATVLITGRVLPGTPGSEIANLLLANETVDGLDVAGNFFTLVTLNPGQNIFEFTAIDSLGISSTQSLVLIGEPPVAADLENLVSIPESATELKFARTRFNRLLNEMFVNLSITNTSAQTISASAIAAFSGFDSSAVSLSNASGTRLDGSQYLTLSPVMSPTGLTAGDTTEFRHLHFANAELQRFSFTIAILQPVNSAPRITSAPKLIGEVAQTYTYDATAIDPDGETISFDLISAPAGMTIDALTGSISWTPVAGEVGSHNVQVAAMDTRGASAIQSFLLTVASASPANRAPLFASSAITDFNLNVAGSADYFYEVIALDPDNDPLAYSLIAPPTGMTIDSQSGIVTWSLTAAEPGSHDVSIVANDGNGNSARQDYVLNVVDVVPGEIRGTVYNDLDGDGDFGAGEVGLPGFNIYHDANGNQQLDAGELTVASNSLGEYVLSGLLPGTYFLRQVSKTEFDQTEPDSGFYTVSIAAGESQTGLNFGNRSNGNSGNGSPLITSNPLTEAKVGSLYQYQISAIDPDGDSLTFTLLTAPTGMTVEPNNSLIQWTPTDEQQSTSPVLVQVDDGNGNLDVQSFNIYARPQFQSPWIVSQPPLITTVNQLYQYDVLVEDPDNETITFQLISAPAGMTISAAGAIQWTPSAADLGEHQVVISAVDASGLAAIQSYELSARDINLAPQFTSDPILSAAAGENYIYNAVAIDGEDSIEFSLLASPAGMRIDGTTGQVTWNSAISDIGAHTLLIRATDARGLFADQQFSLDITADQQAPNVSIVMSGTLREPGQSVIFQVAANDNAAVTAMTLSVDGTLVTLDANNTFEFTPVTPGLVLLEATASDAAGNVGYTTNQLRVIDPLDTEAPLVQIDSPAIDSRITYLTDIVGTVIGDDVELYRLQYSLFGMQQWVTFAEQKFLPSTAVGAGQVNLVEEVLGVFDPTLLANDSYDIRLLAQDFSGNIGIQQIFVSVEGEAKLGNFTLEFTDLIIPLAGIPITINRVYDTLNAQRNGDFGFGWNLSLGEANIRESVPVSSAERSGVPAMFAGGRGLRIGDRVFITIPEGRRVAFTFDPVAEAQLLGTAWHPRFTADAGVYETLTVDDVTLSQLGDGTFGLYLIGFPYNPSEYTLTTKDGVSYTYDQFDELQTIEDRNGVTLEYRGNGIFSSTGESITWIRDDQGRIAEIVDPAGNSILYSYDASGDLISYSDQVSNTWTMDYRSDVPHYLERVFGPRGNLINQVRYDDDGRFVALVDSLGNEIRQDYDLENNEFLTEDALGNITTLEYDDLGNLTREIDALTNATIYEYSDPRHPYLETAITNARGFTTYFTYDERGNLTLLEEPGRFTRYEYDLFNNLTRTIGPFATLADEPTARTTVNVYDSNGNVRETIDALGNSQYQTVDGFGRITSITDRHGFTTQFVYDQFIGSPTKIINPDLTFRTFAYNHVGRLISQTNEFGVVVATIDYDDAGRRLQATGADGQSTTSQYNANLLISETVRINGTDSRATTYQYDANDRLYRQTDANGGVIQVVHDANDNVLSLTDPIGNITSYVFNELNLQIQETDPLGGITNYDYDPIGNLIEKTDRLGRQLEFVYDPMNQQTAENWFNPGGSLVQTSTFSYDIFGNLLSASDPNSSYAYTYDILDRLITSDNAGTPGAPNVILTYAYDNVGNRIQVSDNTGVTVDSQYGTRNELLSKTWYGGEVDDARVEFDYDVTGNELATRRYSDLIGDGTTNLIGRTEKVYDNSGRLVRVTHLDGSDIVLASYEYEFDLANRINQQSIDNNTVNYEFDLTGQLTAANNSDPTLIDEFYIYDLNGNRIESHLHSTGYQIGTNNQLLSDGEFDHDFDAEGNLIRKTEIATGEFTEFDFDHRNRMVKATVKSSGGNILSEVEFIYDAFGRRIVTITDADGAGPDAQTTEIYVYDGDNVWSDFDGSGQTIARYLFGDSIDSNFARWNGMESTTWYLTDHLGTVRANVNSLGAVTNRVVYDSFGNVLSETASNFGDRYKFTGRESNATIGLTFSRARFLDLSIGRFVSVDPLGFESGDENHYRYVFNSPILLLDPSGRLAVSESGAENSGKSSLIRGAQCLGKNTAVVLATVAIELALSGDLDFPDKQNLPRNPSSNQVQQPPPPKKAPPTRTNPGRNLTGRKGQRIPRGNQPKGPRC